MASDTPVINNLPQIRPTRDNDPCIAYVNEKSLHWNPDKIPAPYIINKDAINQERLLKQKCRADTECR